MASHKWSKSKKMFFTVFSIVFGVIALIGIIAAILKYYRLIST